MQQNQGSYVKRFNNGGYNQNQGYNQGGYNQGGYNQQPRVKKKHSGATLHRDYCDKVTGQMIEATYITAWNYSKSRGMISLMASPRKDAAKRKTANPKFENWAVKVNFKKSLEIKWYNGFYNKTTGKLTIKDMEMTVNPKAKNGGYFGTYVKS